MHDDPLLAHLVGELYLDFELLHLIFYMQNYAMLQAATCTTCAQTDWSRQVHASDQSLSCCQVML